MATEMIRVDSDVIQRALKKKPKYLNKTGYFSQLIERVLNQDDTLGSERERAYSYSYRDRDSLKGEGISTENENWIKEQKNLPKPKDLLFEQFWRTYRSAPKGVSSASKVKAQEQWNKAVKKTGSGQKLIEAAQKAVQDQKLQMEVNGDCLCLPDAFRWLRDEMYEALLEAPIIGTQEQQNSDKPLIL